MRVCPMETGNPTRIMFLIGVALIYGIVELSQHVNPRTLAFME